MKSLEKYYRILAYKYCLVIRKLKTMIFKTADFCNYENEAVIILSEASKHHNQMNVEFHGHYFRVRE